MTIEEITAAEEIKTIEQIIVDVADEERELWSGGHRHPGAPTKSEVLSFGRRDETVVAIARSLTETYTQTIRHIYYVCSAHNIVGKDHGKEAYWYTVVKDAIGKARWNEKLAWDRIADDSRPFETPSFWDDHRDFLRNMIPAFDLDRWKGQKTRVIICTEKNAIMGMLHNYCYTWHIPLMSFHGQASDGGGVYTLAKYIAGLTDKCGWVTCLYLGDFDPSGCGIDRSVFGDEEAEYGSDDNLGRLNRLLWQLVKYGDCPTVMYERVGVTPEDVCNGKYADYLIEANTKKNEKGKDNDNHLARYIRDTEKIEGFPSVNNKPATLGIDILSAEELIARIEPKLNSVIQYHGEYNTAWKAQEDELDAQKTVLREIIPDEP
jgi:hypothetical protein